MADDIMDMISNRLYGLDFMEDAVHQMCLSLIMHPFVTSRCNPLLFWVGVILQTEEFGQQPRFSYCDLQDSLTTREKLEAIVHYARVFILDYAYFSWMKLDTVSEEWKITLERALNKKDTGWADKGTGRPAMQMGDPDDFDAPYWRSFINHFNQLSRKWLVKGSQSPIGVILKLLDA
jgi:hypothetical protein